MSESIQCRSADEVQRAHDILVSVILGELPMPSSEESKKTLATVASGLCWVLRHEHNRGMADTLASVETWAIAHGFTLDQHPAPQVARDTDVYKKAQFDLELWQREGLKRDNFTCLLFHLIAKADPERKALLRTVFSVECQVFDDWRASGKL